MKRCFSPQTTRMVGTKKTTVNVSAESSLTEYIEFGPPGAQGGLCGLTLVQGVIGQLSVGDL